ncbi:hypothetical protein WN943_013055 [Citrus x changshan-huyou]
MQWLEGLTTQHSLHFGCYFQGLIVVATLTLPMLFLVAEWEKTSLGKSIRFFRSSFLQPLLKSCKEEMESGYKAKIQQTKNSLSW